MAPARVLIKKPSVEPRRAFPAPCQLRAGTELRAGCRQGRPWGWARGVIHGAKLLMEVLSHLVMEQKARGTHPALPACSCLPSLGHSREQVTAQACSGQCHTALPPCRGAGGGPGNDPIAVKPLSAQLGPSWWPCSNQQLLWSHFKVEGSRDGAQCHGHIHIPLIPSWDLPKVAWSIAVSPSGQWHCPHSLRTVAERAWPGSVICVQGPMDRAGSRTSLHDRKTCVIPCKYIFNYPWLVLQRPQQCHHMCSRPSPPLGE